ncbi:hypothetical protein LCM08_20680 [Salipiger pacificus]|nr:hypothetical protein [Alloyangia pacifica]
MRLALILAVVAAPAVAETQTEKRLWLACSSLKLAPLSFATASWEVRQLAKSLRAKGDDESADAAVAIAEEINSRIAEGRSMSDGVCD